MNGDGIADILVVGQGSGGLVNNGGNAYIVFGKTTTTDVLLSNVALGVGGLQITPDLGQNFSEVSIASGGDFNLDGFTDFVIGTPHDSKGGGDAGAVYVVYGGSTRVDLSLISQGVGGAKIVGTTPGGLFGSSVAVVPDSNGDGRPELLVGSTGAGFESVALLQAPTSWIAEPIYGTEGDDIIGVGYGGLLKVGVNADTILGLGGNDTISGGAGNDVIEGNEGNDALNGNAGNDELDGGFGADAMSGGTGDDTYYVDNALDLTIENAGEGYDTVITAANFTLSANIEALTLVGLGANGTGNDLNNVITGNASDNVLVGGLGADTLIGGLGNDTFVVDNVGDIAVEAVGEGNDTVISSVDWTLADSGIENLQLTGAARVGTGNAFNDAISGTVGDDTLDGRAGADTLSGGAGNDLYFIDNAGDHVVEGGAGGTDTVIASVDYTLEANVENLQLAGAARLGTGNGLANTITGTDGDDTLDGGAGADTLVGGLGDHTYIIDNAADAVIEAAFGGLTRSSPGSTIP